MYAETSGLMLPTIPYLVNFSHQVQQFQEFSCSLKPNASLESTIPDYSNLGGEGDLFNAPKPLIIGEPLAGVDPITGAISMLSCGEDVISCGHLLSEVFYECRKDLLAKEGNVTPLSEVFTIEIPTAKLNDGNDDDLFIAEGIFQKSTSLPCLSSMDHFVLEATQEPRFRDFPVSDFGAAAYGMRRAFSEGDIKALGTARMTSICASEDRMEKLSRYWIKKSKRNFGKKLKYACRKVLADSQPRIRGRFAKTEEIECSKKG